MLDFLLTNWFQIVSSLGLAIAYIVDRSVTKRKSKAEADEAQGNALDKMQQAYDKFVSDSNRKIDELLEKIKQLETNLSDTNVKLENANIELLAANKERVVLRERIIKFEAEATKDKKLIVGLTKKVNNQQTLINEQKKRIKELETRML